MDALAEELRRIDWSRYETAYGIATNVPNELEQMFSKNHADAMNATHELWCGLCHQHAYVSSAALPALPFLLRGLDLLDDKLKVELLDILYGFALCTSRDGLSEWQDDLRKGLLGEAVRFRALTLHPNQEVADWARYICEALELT